MEDLANLGKLASRDQIHSFALIATATMLYESDKMRRYMGLSWRQAMKFSQRPEVLPPPRDRYIYISVGKLYERNRARHEALLNFKPSFLKLLIRFPDAIQDDIIETEQAFLDEERGIQPSTMSYSRLRMFAVSICRSMGISYRRKSTVRRPLL